MQTVLEQSKRFQKICRPLVELNKLWETFLPQGKASGVSEIDIQNIRSYNQLTGKDLTSCSTRDSRVSSFFKFKTEHPELILLAVDKSHNYILLHKTE